MRTVNTADLTLLDADGGMPPPSRGPRPVGSGGFGVIYRARRNGDPASYAYKIIHDPVELERELRVARRVEHPHVMPCMAVVCDGMIEKGYLMPLMDGTLLDLLRRHRPAPTLEAATAALLGAQVCRGLEYLHTSGIVHRDLHISNICYCLPAGGVLRAARLVIGDWNCSKGLRGYTRHTKYAGADAIIPPECRGKGRGVERVAYGVSYDIYGLVSAPLTIMARSKRIIQGRGGDGYSDRGLAGRACC
jgi:serine/threonine protein kinase